MASSLSLSLEVVLLEEGPYTEFDDELRSAVKERLEGGDVSQLSNPLLSPAFFFREGLIGDRTVRVLGPHLVFDILTILLCVTLISGH